MAFPPLSRGPFSINSLESAPAFVHCSKLGGSVFRGTDLLALVGNQSVIYFCPLYRGPYFR